MDDATPQHAPTAAFDADALSRVGGILSGVVASGDLAGAVNLIWRKGEVVRLDIVGLADIATGAPMRRDTLFRIASMSKPITSVAVMMLIEAGALSLDDSIVRWCPEFADMRVLKSATGPLDDTYPAPREITVLDLLTHRAGLAYGFTSVGPIAHAHQSALGDVLESPDAPDAWMAALAGLPLSYPPGERFHYSHATDVLGFLVGRVAGTDFRSFLMDKIFAPLGMVDTDFWIPPEKRERAATVYRQDDATGALEPVAFPRHDQPPAFCGGGGGMISTADDYLKFARMLLNDGEVDGVRLLRPETVALMRTNQLTDAQRQMPFLGMPFWEGQGFGLGVSMILDAEKHAWMGAGSNGAFGWPGAFGTWWQADPVEDLIVLYMIQNAIPLGPEAVANMGQPTRMGARIALPMVQKIIYAALGK